MSDLVLRFLTRQGCALCDEARPLLLAVAARYGVVLEELDVDADDHLSGVYGTRVPVVLGPDDRVIAEGVIGDERALRRAIRRAGAR